ncbi:MAG: site-specific DNA-methyltransferase [Muribaculaceae bacterium]|nr:site-specific DNA-methyltransferase [Muribaculaceae bacterium]
MKATDRHKLIDRIKTIEGLTDDERSALLGLLRETKTYGLVWEDKPEDVEERLRNELPVLVEDKDRALTDGGSDAPNHILIEGDNLEALATLAYTHAGKIDVIYIDPPYNTGNEDFTYNDNYVNSDDDYKHSMWLSFMKRRLRIAKKLLSERGVIFISIDDNEAANLKVLCDDSELFGAKNFAGQFIWHQGRKSMAAQFAVNHEYCLVYCKNRAALLAYDLETENNNWREKKEGLQDIYAEFDRLSAIHGSDYSSIEKSMKKFYKDLPSDNPAKRSQHYTRVDEGGLYFADNISQGTGKGGRFDIIHPKTGKPCKVPGGGWRFGESKLPELLENNLIHFGKDETIVPCLKRYLRNTEYEVMSSVFYRDGRGATKRLEMLLGNKAFDHPKDEEVIAKFIKAVTSYTDKRSYTILDFFAGSGTTLHSVMMLNAEDGGKRTCILCTNNENGICENVTYERNKRVIEGYTKPNGEHVEGLHNNNLRYYRTDFVGRSRSTKNMRRLVQLSTDMLCIKENLYAEKKTFAGLPTFKNIYRYFEQGDKKMLVIYDERYVEEIVKMIEKVETNSKIKVYVFSPSEDPWEASFEPVIDKVELCALPQAIYNTYKRILPKPKRKSLESEEEEALTVSDEEEIGGLFAEEGGDE